MPKKGAPTTTATTELVEQGVPYALHKYEKSATVHFYGREIADSLGIDPARVFETLIALTDGEPISVVVPTSSMLNVAALAAAVGASTGEITSVEQAEKISGFEVTAVSPIGQRKKLTTVVDITALDFPTIYISAGLRGYAVEVSADDLIRITEARTAPVSWT
ncbi:MAG: YbaK/EbsC family protein [Actinomycetes bacterium]